MVIPALTATAYLLIFDGFADWEPALACAELNKSTRFQVRTVSLTGAPVTSMGGIRIIPDMNIDECDVDTAAVLILPGGDMWEGGERADVSALIGRCVSAGVPIAAICAATLAVAHTGLLNAAAHTSNFPGYIDSLVETYTGGESYVDAPAVGTASVITASGMGSVEFAYEVLKLLGVYSQGDLAIWLQVFGEKRVP